MSRTGDYTDGCATFFRRSRFELIADRFVEYKTPDIPLLDRDNVALLALLRLKSGPSRLPKAATDHALSPHAQSIAQHAPLSAVNSSDEDKRGGVVCISNTHLLFNPKRGDVKLAQVSTWVFNLCRFPPAITPTVLSSVTSEWIHSPCQVIRIHQRCCRQGAASIAAAIQCYCRMKPLSALVHTSLKWL